MTTTRFAIVLGLSAAFAPAAPSQDQATTLAELVTRSDRIAQMRVLAARDVGGGRRVILRGQHAVRGPLPRTVEIAESSSAPACGRSLFGVIPGQSFLVFLVERPSGLRLAASNGRALVSMVPGLLEHVRALVVAPSAEARLHVIAGGLESPIERIRRDAALGLPRARGLERLSRAGRELVAGALARALESRSTDVHALVRTARRLRLVEALDTLVDRYLVGATRGLDTSVRDTIVAIDSEQAVRRIAARPPADSATARRAVELLGALNSPAATRALSSLAAHSAPEVAIDAGVALLARGLTADGLCDLVGADRAAACVDRHATGTSRPRFRSILGGHSR